MPTRVQLPNGQLADFPDGMDKAAIEAVLQKQFPAKATPVPTRGTRFEAIPGSDTPEAQANRLGSMVPQAVVPALDWMNRYLVQPFEKAAEAGAEVGRIGARGIVETLHPNLTPEQTAQQHPVQVGIAQGAGAVAGGAIADPRNWPFFGSGMARPILKRVISGGFTTMMSKGTLEAAQNLHDNWDQFTPQQRWELGTQAGLSGLFAAAAAHGVVSEKAPLRKQERVTPVTAEPVKSTIPSELPIPTTAPLEQIAEEAVKGPVVPEQVPAPLLPEPPLTAHGTGGTSVEELARNEKFLRVNPAGLKEFQGVNPDPATELKPNEAIIAVRPDGGWRYQSGNPQVADTVAARAVKAYKPELAPTKTVPETPEQAGKKADFLTSRKTLEDVQSQLEKVSRKVETVAPEAEGFDALTKRKEWLTEEAGRLRDKSVRAFRDYLRSVPREQADTYLRGVEAKGVTQIKAVEDWTKLAALDEAAKDLRQKLATATPEVRQAIHELTGDVSSGKVPRFVRYIPKGEAGEVVAAKIVATQKFFRMAANYATDPKLKQKFTALSQKTVMFVEGWKGAEPLMEAANKGQLAGMFPRLSLQNMRALTGKKLSSKGGWLTSADRTELQQRLAQVPDEAVAKYQGLDRDVEIKRVRSEFFAEKQGQYIAKMREQAKGKALEAAAYIREGRLAIGRHEPTGLEARVNRVLQLGDLMDELATKAAKDAAEQALKTKVNPDVVVPDTQIRPAPKLLTSLWTDEAGSLRVGGYQIGAPPQRPVAATKFEQIQNVREAAMRLRKPTFFEKLRLLPDNVLRHMYDQFVNLPGSESKAAELAYPELRGLRPETTEESPYRQARLATGGGGGIIQARQIQMARIAKAAESEGLLKNLTAYLDAKGYEREIALIQTKRLAAGAEMAKARAEFLAARNALHVASDPGKIKEMRTAQLKLKEARANYKDFDTKLKTNKVVPAKLDPLEIAKQLQQMQTALGLDFAKVEGWAKEVWALNRKTLDQMHAEGIVSDAAYQDWTSRGDAYVPMHRIQDVVDMSKRRFGGSALSLRTERILKEARGSERINIDPIQDSMRQQSSAIQEIERNKTSRILIEFLDKSGSGLAEEVPKGYIPKAGEGVVGYYIKGEPRSFRVPSYMADALNLSKPQDAKLVMTTILQNFKSVFQKGTTIANLGFSLPNVFRDVQDVAVLSKAGLGWNPLDYGRFVRQWTQSLERAIVESPDYIEFLESRAAFSTLQKNISPESFLGEYHAPMRKPWRIIKTIEDFNNALEEATKLTTYRRMRKAGFSVDEAAWETRVRGGSPDFASMGISTQQVNLLWMFFNANVQGIGRTAKWVATHPGRLAGVLGTFTLMSLALHKWNSQYTDEEGKPLWDRVPETDKQNYFNIIYRHGTYPTSQGGNAPYYFKIPKGHTPKVLFNPIEDVVTALIYKHQVTGAQSALNVLSNLLPGQFNLKSGGILSGIGRGLISSMNPLMKESFEQAANQDTFRGIPIIKKSLEGVEAKEQFSPATSVTARKLGSWLKISPLRIEHAISGLGGGLADQLRAGVDEALGQKQAYGMPLQGNEALARNPWFGVIIRRFVGSVQDQREKDLEESFYKYSTDAHMYKATFNQMKRQEPVRAMTYAQDPQHRNYIAADNILVKMEKQLADSRRKQMQIVLNPAIPMDQKQKLIQSLYQYRMKLLQGFDAYVKPALAPK